MKLEVAALTVASHKLMVLGWRILLQIAYWRCFAFNALTLLVGRQEGHVKNEWWGAGVVVCLEQGADLHMAS